MTLNWMLLGSCVLDLAVASGILYYPWERHLDADTLRIVSIPRFVLAALGMSAIFLFKLPVFILLGLDMFGTIHLVYLDLVIVLPLLGLGAFIVSRWGKKMKVVTPSAKVLSLLMISFAFIGLWASFVEPFRLQLEKTELSLSPAPSTLSPFKIGVLADLQTREITAYEEEAVDRLLAEKPDLILVPGDIYQGEPDDFDRELPKFRKLLSRLKAPAGVYSVRGNVDRHYEYAKVIEGTGVMDLENRSHEIEFSGRKIKIVGLAPSQRIESKNPLWKPLLEPKAQNEFRILLSHYPDPVLDLPKKSPVDLVVSGHTHGGQICVPLWGPILVLSRVPLSVGAGGLSEVAGNRIYISRGVGVERDQAPRIRFFCPPEISVITVK